MRNSLENTGNNAPKITNELILELISFIDLTSLGNTDTEPIILELIRKANKGVHGVYPAAVCTFANFSDFVSANINPQIKIAAVGGSFPTGQNISAIKIEEVNHISKTKADEVDIVLNRGDLISENYDRISQEIDSMKNTLGQKHLKVILETGDLDEAQIKKAAELSILSGADFIKTSTGKTSIGAEPEAVKLMCEVIKSHFIKTGKKIGIKPSGGIRTVNDALQYYSIVKNILGDTWLTPALFRIGASSLYDNLVNALNESS